MRERLRKTTVPLVAASSVFVSSLALAQTGPGAQPGDLGISGPAPAARAGQPWLGDSLTGSAREAYLSARILLNNKDVAGALSKFQQAYDLSREPRLLFDMAVCARDLHAYARMRSLLRRYKVEGASTMSPGMQAQVEAALAAIANFVGLVNLTVSQPHAIVLVDGEPAGTTPLGFPLQIDLGRHTVGVRLDGYQPVDQAVDVLGGATTDVAIDLQRSPESSGHLVVTTEADASVVVDALPATLTSFDRTLAVGRHHVRVTETGKATYDADVDLREGETRTMDISMRDSGQGGSPWPWIAGCAAVVVAAAVGGYFLLKPNDTTNQVTSYPPTSLGTVYVTR